MADGVLTYNNQVIERWQQQQVNFSAGSLQLLVPGDRSFALEAVASGRLSLQAAGVETTTTTTEVTMTMCNLRSPVPAGVFTGVFSFLPKLPVCILFVTFLFKPADEPTVH